MTRTSTKGAVLLLVLWGAAVLLLTTQSRHFPPLVFIMGILGDSEIVQISGHYALFGSLTALAYWALAHRLRPRWALLLAMGIVLVLGLLTEWSQQRLPDRTATAADLLANWLGVFSVGFWLSYARLKPSRPAGSPVPRGYRGQRS